MHVTSDILYDSKHHHRCKWPRSWSYSQNDSWFLEKLLLYLKNKGFNEFSSFENICLDTKNCEYSLITTGVMVKTETTAVTAAILAAILDFSESSRVIAPHPLDSYSEPSYLSKNTIKWFPQKCWGFRPKISLGHRTNIMGHCSVIPLRGWIGVSPTKPTQNTHIMPLVLHTHKQYINKKMMLVYLFTVERKITTMVLGDTTGRSLVLFVIQIATKQNFESINRPKPVLTSD